MYCDVLFRSERIIFQVYFQSGFMIKSLNYSKIGEAVNAVFKTKLLLVSMLQRRYVM